MQRKLWIALVFGFVLAMAATAVSAAPTWEVVLAGGLNVTDLYGSDTNASVLLSDPSLGSATISGNIDNYDAGFASGALVNLYFNDRVGLQSGLTWGRKGGKGKVRLQTGSIDASVDVDVSVDYLEIPLALLVKIPAGTSVAFHVLGGGAVGFNTNAQGSLSFQGLSESTDIGNEVKNVDFGVLLGAGMSVPIQQIAFVLDARWTLGMTSIDDSGANLDIKNNAFSFLVGIGVPLGYRP